MQTVITMQQNIVFKVCERGLFNKQFYSVQIFVVKVDFLINIRTVFKRKKKYAIIYADYAGNIVLILF